MLYRHDVPWVPNFAKGLAMLSVDGMDLASVARGANVQMNT